ncbi:MAG: pantetheine-phosphate adenylyltransferase [Lachnospiraceae bacterium]|nr:pantetheine-phosphate adenylyltransferase [Lachnospiraceae bacterium]
MITAIYPGSFDPVTLGHLDIITRSANMFDKVIIGVLNNTSKKPLFSLEERVNMLTDAVSGLDNVSVECFNGLLVDFVKQKKSNIIIRGLRALTDFDLEMQMAQGNRVVAPDVDTVFLSTSVQYSYLSSSVVKEYARYGVDLKEFVPECVIPQLIDKIK